MSLNQDSEIKLGWIGLGKMGQPMALNLQTTNKNLSVFNRSPEKTILHSEANGHVSSSVAELSKRSDLIFTMISDDSAIEEIAFGNSGIITNARRGTVLIEMSTISPSASIRIAEKSLEKGISYLRAPVNGTVIQAEDGSLVILVSGPRNIFDNYHHYLEILGKNIFYIGESEQARYLKLCLNTMVGISASMMGEALALGESGGLDWNTMIEIISASAVGSPLVNYKMETLKNRDFKAAFSAYQMAKDFDIILSSAKENHVPMPITSIVRQQWSAMIGTGRGNLDYFAYVEMLEDLAGINNK